MAMIPVSAAELDFDAVDQPATAAGDEVENNGEVQYWIRNNSGAPRTVRFLDQRPCRHKHHGLRDRVVTVATGGPWKYGPFQPHAFSDTHGRLQVRYDSATSVLVAAFRYPRKY